MLRPLDLDSKLSVLLEESSAEIVDMSSIEEKRTALNTCRAPALGWKDYIKGKEYTPPTKSHDVTTFYGPKDGTAWTKDDEGRPMRAPSNPHSEQYGGVRPWSPDEIILALYDPSAGSKPAKTSGMFPYGLKSLIDRFENHARAARPSKDYDWTDYVGPALDMLNMAITKDRGKVGTEFTKYIALNMDLSGGAAPGLKGEHRVIRGILTKLAKLINRVATQVESGDYDPQALLDTVGKIGQRTKLRDADPSVPRNENMFGGFAKALHDIYHGIEIAIHNGDGDRIREIGDEISKLYEDVEDQEAQYSGEGMAHGSLGSQPRDLPAIGTPQHRIKATKFHIYVVDPDTDKMDMARITRAKKVEPEDIVLRRDPESGAPLRRHYIDIEQDSSGRAVSIAKDKYAVEHGWPRIMVALLPFEAEETEENVGGGFHSVSPMAIQTGSGKDAEFTDHPGLAGLQDKAANDPEFKEEMTDILYSLRYGSSKQRVGQARRADAVVDHLLSAIEHVLNPRPRPKLVARPDTRVGETTKSVGPRGGEAPKFKAGGFNIIDVDKDQIVARADSEREASHILDKMNNSMLTSLQYVAGMLSRSKLGDDYNDELSDMAREVVHAIKIGDEEALADAVEDLHLTKKVVQDDIEADPEEHAPLLTDREYRIALRKLGISDYPEKGTINDPEIDEEGRLSMWAQAGYPIVMKDPNTGAGALSGTLYEPGAGDEAVGEVMLDKHISKDLGVSAQSVGIIWRKVQDKLAKLSEQLYEHHVWAGDLDEIDLQVLRETCNKLAMVMVEEIRAASHIITEQLYA